MERPQQADSIVTKHRSGLPGEATWYFKQDQLRFTNLDVVVMEDDEELEEQCFPFPSDEEE